MLKIENTEVMDRDGETLINGFLHEKYTPYYERR